MRGKPSSLSCITFAFKLLGRRAHCVHEINAKLERKGYEKDEIAATVQKLQNLGYLDDAKYCKAYASARVERMKIGPAKLAAELSRKGFAGDLVNSVVAGIFGGPEDQFQVAQKAAMKKFRTIAKKVEAGSARRKVFDHLVRRGFSMEIARRVVFNGWKELAGGGR
ncbi:MAG: regulatory protein RecX [Nitrospinae bacterium]|nr:regulatory protein RecX [Nitrospinota bacterium]